MAYAAAQHGTTVAGEVPRHADARLEVPVVLLIDLVNVDPHAEKRCRALVEDDELVVPFCRRDVPLVAHAEFEREPVANGDAILKEQTDRALIDVAPPFAERDVERVGRAGEKRRHARKVEHPGALGEVLVDEVPVLAAEADRVPAARARECVHEHVRRVVPAHRQRSRTAEVEGPGDDHLRQPDRARNPVADAELRWIELVRRIGSSAQAAAAESRFVEQRWSKHVRLGDGRHAGERPRDLTEPRDAVALRARLERLDLLAPVVGVQPIARAEVEPEIERGAIGVDDGRSRADESGRPIRIEEVGAGNQRDQLSNDWIGGGGALLVAEDEAVDVDALTMPDAFIGREKVRLSTKNRTANRPAKLVALERVGLAGRELEEVPRVERVVSQELECVAVKLVGARSRDDVHDGSRHVPVLGRERRVVHFELLDAGDRRFEDQRAERQVVARHAVDQESNRLFTIAGSVEGKRAHPANGPGRKPGLRWGHRAGHEKPEISEVAPVQRNLLDGLRSDDIAERRRGTVDERRLRADEHRFISSANRQVEVPYQRAANVDTELFDDFGAKPRGLRR